MTVNLHYCFYKWYAGINSYVHVLFRNSHNDFNFDVIIFRQADARIPWSNEEPHLISL